jgi:DNA helicase-2/ATP-dependent DNA helicase PcrA
MEIKMCPENIMYEKEEKEIQDQVNACIDNKKSIEFSAGAGAGKTYALIESLKYIIGKYSNDLIYHNQKIMCITYTNVATNLIKERLGHSELIRVSTIHDRLWSLIKEHQKELIVIHVEKLKKELADMKCSLEGTGDVDESKEFKPYIDLSENQKTTFNSVLLKGEVIDDFYKYYDTPAKEFRSALEKYFNQLPATLMSNVLNFKRIVRTIYKIYDYEECLKKIELKDKNYLRVKYDDKRNQDRLEKMRFSHDTLLEYAFKMVSKYDLLKRVILDTYPFILIDEYQDANKYVVEIMALIEAYATSINRKIFVGYFGDSAQNIYEDGVGNKLREYHPGLMEITKCYNRRSYDEIIDVVNKIRNDKVKQKSIYKKRDGGTFRFYTGSKEIIEEFIEGYKKEWNINGTNKLHCLVLLNKSVAEFNDFPEVYEGFAKTPYYKQHYDRINNELLSNELHKLGEVPNIFFSILQFIYHLRDKQTSIDKIIDKNIYADKMRCYELKQLVKILSDLKGNTFGDFVKDMLDKYTDLGSMHYRKVVDRLIDFNTYRDFKNMLIDKLYMNNGEWKLIDFKEKLIELFETEIISKNDKGMVILDEISKYIDGEYFSCSDINDVKAFKSRLFNILDEKKNNYSDLNETRNKIDKLINKEIISDIDQDDVDKANQELDSLLNIELEKWFVWFRYIKGDNNSDIEFHTYHGTKGEEYNNVIIIMENDFGIRNKNKFPSFFKNYGKSDLLSEEDNNKYINTRNLLYVSCSRAIINLRILYINDVAEFKENLEEIFGEIMTYSLQNNGSN